MWRVIVPKQVEKQLFKLRFDRILPEISAIIDSLATEPRPKSAKKLVGKDNVYRIRSGKYRIVYQIIAKELVILLVDVAPRKDIYRNL